MTAEIKPIVAQDFARCAPHNAGLDETCLAALIAQCRAAGQDLHSLLLFHGGKLVLENYWWPYGPARRQVMHSIAKSFTSAAIGLALAEGRFGLTDRVVSFCPEFAPAIVDEKLAAMTVEDLLTMRAGHGEEISGSVWRRIETSWIAEFFKLPVVHQPGSTYVYSSAASYMLSAILTCTTGQTLHDYLKPRLFEPLGIFGESWDIGADGLNPGGNGLTCKPIDLLKFGVLYAQGGVWQGRRILPADWVARSVATHTPGDPGFGYGYQWHTGPDGEFYATGLFGQMIAVFPQHDVVVVVTSATPGRQPCMGQILPLLQKHMPAITHRAKADPALARLCNAAATPRPLVSLSHAADTRTHRYWVLENPLGIRALTLGFANGSVTLTLEDRKGAHSIAMGLDHWIESQTDMPGQDLHHGYALQLANVVAGARWLDRDTLETHWIFVESVFVDTVTVRLGVGQVSLERRVNVNSGALAWPVLVARA